MLGRLTGRYGQRGTWLMLLGSVYIAFLVIGCLLLALIALWVERRIPAHVNGVGVAPASLET